jgi:hypothetical protein
MEEWYSSENLRTLEFLLVEKKKIEIQFQILYIYLYYILYT